MDLDDNKALVEKFIDVLWRQGQLDQIGEIVADDYLDWSFGPDPVGRDGLAGFIAGFRNAFPDLEYDLHDMIAEDDLVVSRDTVRATHTADFMGIPVTGKRIEVGAMHILRIADGKVVEHWGETNRFAMMQQLGVIDGGGG